VSLFAELKRRNVFRVGIAYVVGGWLLLQLTDVLSQLLDLPEVVGRVIVMLVVIGLPVALFFAWAFEITPEGVKREKYVDRSQSITPQTGKKLNNTILVLMALAIAYLLYDKFSGATQPGLAQSGSDHFSQPTAGKETKADEKSVLTPVEATNKSALTPVEATPTQKSIVVLPFINMSNDPEQEFFSDGLSEELLNVLAQIRDLRVISRTSAFAFKGKDVDIPTIAAQLNVTHVLEGSVRKAGNDVRITAQLIEVATDSHLWSDAYNRKLENVFEIQEEISKAIAAELQVTLGTSAKAGKPTQNLEAWQLYLRGRHLYQNRGKAQVVRAIELLKQAVALDPEFADAWANLAAANMINGYNQDEGYENFYRDGQQAARRAIAIDPDNGFAHAVLGLVYMGEFAWDEAMREYDLAIRLNPNETNSLLWKGIALTALGYVDQAIAMFKQAERLDPVFTNVHNWLALAYGVNGDTENLRHHTEKLQRLDPDFPINILTIFRLNSDNLDTAEDLMRAEDIRSIGTDVLVETMFSALRDPGRKEGAVKTLLANEHLAEAGDLTPYLWNIGAVDETLANFRKQKERGLRKANTLPTLWDANNQAQLSNPAMIEFFEANGMVDYWREHGDPDYCRVEGTSVECGET
jgi:TolB-like protein